VLSADERERAAQLLDRRAQERWSASRAVLRDLLGAATGTDPAALRFQRGPHGKPELRRLSNEGMQVRFNLSHSGVTAIYALSEDREVGVDIEMLDRALSATRNEVAIARRMLGTRVAERLLALPPDQRADEFLRAWVAHEAVVKCLGLGLGGSEADAVLEGAPGPWEATWVTQLDVGESAVAALALRGGEAAFELKRWRAG
jgi:4'-phosphopantetheinyl transferase